MEKFFHIIEHYPPGTIYNLIQPLTKFRNHVVFLLKDKNDIKKLKENLSKYHNYSVVLHCTGRNLPVFEKAEEMFNGMKLYIYMHVSFNYLKYNKRFEAIQRLKRLSQNGVVVLVPSQEVAEQFTRKSIYSIVVRPGISLLQKTENSHLQQYYNKIITTCTESRKKYSKVKGINKLKKLLKNKTLREKLIILGTNKEIIKGVKSKKLSHNDFIDVLSHSLAYIQLSKYESYNITAVEAKQLQIPIILSKKEGHFESCSHGFLVNNIFQAKKALRKVLNREIEEEIIMKNYFDSLKNETLESFNKEFLRLGNRDE